jgi:ribonuclease BN (tRNA processing enzyme)
MDVGGVAMKVQVLGYWGAYPGPGEATTGFLVETEQAKILIDCGSGVLAQLFKVCAMADLTAVVITHHHHDHTADLGVLGYSVLLARVTNQRSQRLPVYMPRGNAALEAELRAEPLIDLQFIEEDSKFTIHGVEVSFARTTHGVYCLATKMKLGDKSFVFSADSSYCRPLVEIAFGADLFLCEASMYAHQEEDARKTGHLTAKQAGELAREAGVKRLVLTHYPHYGDILDLRDQATVAFGKPVEMIETLQVLDV